ncbi:two-component system capsular synthesis response regulator RcsB [Paraburkholderia atlantica]|uniref:Two-component system capsular synthesis response regulator RcsB n=1 Tax=Paraburkholderia atlantica TaxID=2654982 RepID=A0A7W8PV20_PARAM|nr:response regulator transcription factor [Paraburkholderia atlantica]MBB5418438.1 two-component system capsular synthesis response regulator RcsB [Paraburkholderia atlantica]MBB5425265.1 two-component system capsular synthesis response regulator RcsB [Paraburkholderia atlantica]
MLTKIAIADGNSILRIGMRCIFRGQAGLRVVGEAENSTAIIDFLRENEVDILLSDFEIPGEIYRDGCSLMALLRRSYPSTKVIFVTTLTNPLLLRAVIKSKAHGVLLKNDSPEEVISAVRSVSRGQLYIAPSVRRITGVNHCEEFEPKKTELLSAREGEVLRLYVSGMSISEIAALSHRSLQTVSTQRRQGMKKLGFANDRELFEYMLPTRS